MTRAWIAPEGTPPPEHDDGAGRPITLTPDGITRWDTIGTLDHDGLTKEDSP